MRKPRFLSKKEMRGKRSTAKRLARDRAEIESQQKIMNDIIFRNEPGIKCLPCEDEAYANDLRLGFGKGSGGKGVLSLDTQRTIPTIKPSPLTEQTLIIIVF